MTTYHEPPLQSRRAARQNERGDNPPPVVDPANPQSRAELRARRAAPGPVDATGPAAATPPQPVTPPHPAAPTPPPAASASGFAPQAPRAAEPVVASAIDPFEGTLSRRELRALRDEQGRAATPPAAPQLSDRTAGYSELDALIADRRAAAVAPTPLVEPTAPAAPASHPAPPSAASASSVASAVSAASAVEPPAVARGRRAAPAVEPAPAQYVPPQPVQHAPVPPQPVQHAPVAMPPAAPESPSASTAPVGHWSRQAELDDELHLGTEAVVRNVGAGSAPITTSALILPPSADSALGGAMSATGEIFITGSIQLPRSLASHGAHPDQLESTDLDHLLDPDDFQVTATDSQPVRATRAVSTHTGSNTIITAQKPPSNRGTTILIVAAATMAVLVGTILVVAFASGAL